MRRAFLRLGFFFGRLRFGKSVPQGLKPSSARLVTARLKPCPSYKGSSCAPSSENFPNTCFGPIRIKRTVILFLFEAGQCCQNLLAVLLRVHSGPHLDDLALRIDEEGVALRHLYAVVIAHRAVLGYDRLVLV